MNRHASPAVKPALDDVWTAKFTYISASTPPGHLPLPSHPFTTGMPLRFKWSFWAKLQNQYL